MFSGSEFQFQTRRTSNRKGPTAVRAEPVAWNGDLTAARTQTLAENSVRNWRAVVGQIPRSLVVLALVYMSTSSLYWTRSGASSQCCSACMSLVRPRSNFWVSLRTRAAAFKTRCTILLDPANEYNLSFREFFSVAQINTRSGDLEQHCKLVNRTQDCNLLRVGTLYSFRVDTVCIKRLETS